MPGQRQIEFEPYEKPHELELLPGIDRIRHFAYALNLQTVQARNAACCNKLPIPLGSRDLFSHERK